MVTLLEFLATWCQPCRTLAPIIDDIGKIRSDITIKKIDVDKYPEIAERYGVMSIPTIILQKDGQESKRFVGTVGKAEILYAL